jgi:hypothetical protein
VKFADLKAAVNFVYCIWRNEDPNIPRADLRAKLVAAGATPEFANKAMEKARELQRQSQQTASAPNSENDPATQRDIKTSTQRNAEEAQKYADQLKAHIEKQQGVYLLGEGGEFSVLVDGKRIPLNVERNNLQLNGLLIVVCNITLDDYIARPVIARLIQFAYESAGKFTLRQFSAMSKDQERLYIPLKDSSKLLMITADGITTVPNGTNDDNLWIEHPDLDPEAEALDFIAGDPNVGLAEFESLFVNNLPTRLPEMAWFIAMAEVGFPFVRDACDKRMIVEHSGATGDGKTSAAEMSCDVVGLRFTGDASVPWMSRRGDVGLLVMDNKEQADMSQSFSNWLLYLATGGGRDRVGVANSLRRPTGVITSIEGPDRTEALDRLVEVEMNAHERNRAIYDDAKIRKEIRRKRNLIVSALVHVLQRFMETAHDDLTLSIPKPFERFSSHYRVIVRLLRAYAQVSGKPAEWTDHILAAWNQAIQREEAADDYSQFVEQFQRALDVAYDIRSESSTAQIDELLQPIIDRDGAGDAIPHNGHHGALTKFTASELLDWLRKKNPFHPKLRVGAKALGKRLRGIVLENGTQILTENEVPALLGKKREGPGLKQQRFLGLFEPIEDRPKVQLTKTAEKQHVQPAPKLTHWHELPETQMKAMFTSWPAGEKRSLPEVQEQFKQHGLVSSTNEVLVALNYAEREKWIVSNEPSVSTVQFWLRPKLAE